MQTKYYCEKCKLTFSEKKLPNINKLHKPCGSIARILFHEKVGEEEVRQGA